MSKWEEMQSDWQTPPKASLAVRSQTKYLQDIITEHSLYSTRWKWVPSSYYTHWTAKQRASFLDVQAKAPHGALRTAAPLCRAAVIENRCVEQDIDPSYPKFCVIVWPCTQQPSKPDLILALQALRPRGPDRMPSEQFDLCWALPSDAARLTHSLAAQVVCPLLPSVSNHGVPVLLARSAASLRFFWMDTGHWHAKLGMTVHDFISVVQPVVANFTTQSSQLSDPGIEGTKLDAFADCLKRPDANVEQMRLDSLLQTLPEVDDAAFKSPRHRTDLTILQKTTESVRRRREFVKQTQEAQEKAQVEAVAARQKGPLPSLSPQSRLLQPTRSSANHVRDGGAHGVQPTRPSGKVRRKPALPPEARRTPKPPPPAVQPHGIPHYMMATSTSAKRTPHATSDTATSVKRTSRHNTTTLVRTKRIPHYMTTTSISATRTCSGPPAPRTRSVPPTSRTARGGTKRGTSLPPAPHNANVTELTGANKVDGEDSEEAEDIIGSVENDEDFFMTDDMMLDDLLSDDGGIVFDTASASAVASTPSTKEVQRVDADKPDPDAGEQKALEEKALEEERLAEDRRREDERLTNEKTEAEEAVIRAEQERITREKAEVEARARMEEERRLAAEKIAREKAELETKARIETERLAAREQAEAEEKTRLEAETVAREQAEAEEKACLEAERIAREKAEAEEKARLEAERIAREKAEAEEKARLETERIAREKTEAEEKARLEAERIAKEQEAMRVEEERVAAESRAGTHASETKIGEAKSDENDPSMPPDTAAAAATNATVEVSMETHQPDIIDDVASVPDEHVATPPTTPRKEKAMDTTVETETSFLSIEGPSTPIGYAALAKDKSSSNDKMATAQPAELAPKLGETNKNDQDKLTDIMERRRKMAEDETAAPLDVPKPKSLQPVLDSEIQDKLDRRRALSDDGVDLTTGVQRRGSAKANMSEEVQSKLDRRRTLSDEGVDLTGDVERRATTKRNFLKSFGMSTDLQAIMARRREAADVDQTDASREDVKEADAGNTSSGPGLGKSLWNQATQLRSQATKAAGNASTFFNKMKGQSTTAFDQAEPETADSSHVAAEQPAEATKTPDQGVDSVMESSPDTII